MSKTGKGAGAPVPKNDKGAQGTKRPPSKTMKEGDADGKKMGKPPGKY